VAREENLHNTITTKRSTQRWHSGLSRGSAKSTLAYSTLWRPNGRGLQSTPFKRSKDPLEYHGVLLSLYYVPFARNPHNLEGSRPYTLMFTKKHGVRKGWATHTRHKIRATTRTQVATRAHNTTRRVHNSNRALIAITKNQMRGMLRECLVYSSMRLGGPFYSPKAARSRWEHSRKAILAFCRLAHRTLSGADLFPYLAKPTVAVLEPLAHRTLSGAQRTVRCPIRPLARATRHARIPRPTVGRPHHRTVRWILAVRRRRSPESSKFADASLAHRTLSGAPPDSPVHPDWANFWLLRATLFQLYFLWF
jgi:hypothetical protein